MNKIYSSGYFSFKQRLIKNLYAIIFLSFITLASILGNPLIFLRLMPILAISIIFTALMYFANRNAKNYIYQVEIENEDLIFYGETYSKEWKKIVLGKDITMDFKLSGSALNLFHILKFTSTDNSFEINEYNDWHPDLLVEIFERVKEIQNEKITPEEREVINRVIK